MCIQHGVQGIAEAVGQAAVAKHVATGLKRDRARVTEYAAVAECTAHGADTII